MSNFTSMISQIEKEYGMDLRKEEYNDYWNEGYNQCIDMIVSIFEFNSHKSDIKSEIKELESKSGVYNWIESEDFEEGWNDALDMGEILLSMI